MSPDVVDKDHFTAYRPPGTSLIWAGLYKVFGHRYDVVRAAHCLAGALTILVVYAIGRHCFDKQIAMISAGIFTIWPTGLLYSTELLAEALGTLTFLWSVLICLQFAERPKLSRAALGGLLLGASLLIRPSGVWMLPLMGIWGIWQFRKQWRPLVLSLAIPIVAASTFIPWAIRNYFVFREFIPISTMGGSVLLQGNNRIVATDPKYYGYSIWDTKIPEYREALQAPNDEVERDRVAKELAIQWLKDNRDKWWYLIQSKFRRSWTPFLQPESPRMYRIGMLVSWGPILVLFSIAFFPTLVNFLRTAHPGWLIHLAIAHYVINSVIFYALSRYRYTIEGLCIILASTTAVVCYRRIRNRKLAPGRAVSTTATL